MELEKVVVVVVVLLILVKVVAVVVGYISYGYGVQIAQIEEFYLMIEVNKGYSRLVKGYNNTFIIIIPIFISTPICSLYLIWKTLLASTTLSRTPLDHSMPCI